MPRFKPVDHGLQFLAVDLSLQQHPGSFEYALHHLIEHRLEGPDAVDLRVGRHGDREAPRGLHDAMADLDEVHADLGDFVDDIL